MFGMMGMSFSFILIALGIGYIVCSLANKEKGFLKGLGLVVGMLLMLASIYLVGDTVYSVVKMRKMMQPAMRQQMQQPRRASAVPKVAVPSEAPQKAVEPKGIE